MSTTRPSGRKAASDSLVMKALRREPVDRVPIWLMRQAGRYMAEYREERKKHSFLSLCHDPGLCAEIMKTAVEKIGVDAAIIFSDLLPILEPMGFQLEYAVGDGPVIHNPFQSVKDLDRVRELVDLSPMEYVFDTVSLTRKAIASELPVIGFAGAPFTLAGYAIEGGASRTFQRTKTLMYNEPDLWHTFLDRIARTVARYLNEQIVAGADAVQIFDSWVGCLSYDEYKRFVQPHVRDLIAAVRPNAPVILFGTGNPELYPLFAETGDVAVGVDWRIEIDTAWQRIGYNHAIQGNLDPVILLADRETIRNEAKRILQAVGHRPGFIFNLGHGILKDTPVDHVVELVRYVHTYPTH